MRPVCTRLRVDVLAFNSNHSTAVRSIEPVVLPFTLTAGLFPAKGWLPGRFLLALLPADPR